MAVSFSRPSCLQNLAVEIWSTRHSYRKKSLATVGQVEQPGGILAPVASHVIMSNSCTLLIPSFAQFSKYVENLRRSWWTAGNTNIDWNVFVYRPRHGIAAFEHPTIDGTVTECDNDFRIRRLFINIFQRPLHVHGYWAGDHQRVRMARRSCDVYAEPLGVVHGIHERVHLHLAGIAGARVHLSNCQ